ncbi:hypothetical protein ABZ793_16990 [Micromonospora sp. NPDC047465]|uniref:hypothetical protein n=1 Tax=Micromonospora sp. NPDC047465 TaxID=3154813 RepID=UPI0034019161
MRLRVAKVALPLVAVALLSACGGGQDDTGGDSDTGIPKSPEESYAAIMKAIYAGDSQRVCSLMTPDAADRFIGEMRRWKDAEGRTCEGVVDSFASRQSGPPPTEWGPTMYGQVEYPNQFFAMLENCPKDANGDFQPNFAAVTWKKQDGGWIVTEFDISTGCGG